MPVQATGLGSILNLHVHGGPIARPEDLVSVAPETRTLLHLEMIERGFYMARRGFISLSLALNESDLDAFAEAFDDVLATHGAVLAEGSV